jgi:hypothetical protein
MSNGRIDAYDPTRAYENRTECLHERPPAARKAAPPPPPMPPEGLPDASFGPLPKPLRTDTSRVRTVAPSYSPPRSDLQMRLDAFRERATPVLSAEGKLVAVRIPFRMTVDPRVVDDPAYRDSRWAAQERIVRAKEPELKDAAHAAGLSDDDVRRLHEGRATPEQVARVTQAIIDAGHLPRRSPEAPNLEMRIRKMMHDHGVGLDCAGYTQQAYLASRGLARGATGLDPNIEKENLANLSGKGFARVSLADARAGDILVLGSPKRGEAGHTLLVNDHRDATPEEEADLRKQPGFGSGRITAYVLDSSYGSDARFDVGGVMQQIWWRDEKGTWARKTKTTEPDGRKVADGFDVWPRDKGTEKPYGHPIEGVYRPRGELR